MLMKRNQTLMISAELNICGEIVKVKVTCMFTGSRKGIGVVLFCHPLHLYAVFMDSCTYVDVQQIQYWERQLILLNSFLLMNVMICRQRAFDLKSASSLTSRPKTGLIWEDWRRETVLYLLGLPTLSTISYGQSIGDPQKHYNIVHLTDLLG